MYIGIDIDGVLADYVGKLIEVQGLDPNWEPRNYNMIEPGGFDSKEQWLTAHTIVSRDYTNLDVLEEDAPAKIQELISAGHIIQYTTARLPIADVSVNKIEADTDRWLTENGFPRDGNDLVIDNEKYHYGMDILLDDYIHHVYGFNQYSGVGVLKRSSYSENEDVRGIETVGSVAEFCDNVLRGCYQ